MKEKLEQLAHELRIDILRMFYRSKTGHLAPALSCIDILTVLYFGGFINIGKKNNHVVLSKGHGAAALYVCLARLGVIDRAELRGFYQYKSDLLPLTSVAVEGICIPTGSLGQGLCFATGLAKSVQMNGENLKTYVVIGDGEMQEGSIWEAALFAAQHKLENLVVFLDKNNIQAANRVNVINNMEPVQEKWKAFGWDVITVDGHDVVSIQKTLTRLPVCSQKPTLIIANTIKGKGISVLEDKAFCHTQIPKEAEWNIACKDLGITLEDLEIS